MDPGSDHHPSPLRVYVDLSQQEHWNRREWEHLLGQAATTDLRILSEPNEAECELTIGSRHQFGKKPASLAAPSPAPDSPPSFVWDFSDFPMGYEPGFYCSLPRALFDRRRHRAFCYPITYNETIEAFDLADADHLFGFCGAISSGLRGRMIDGLGQSSGAEERMILVQAGPWNAMYDRSGIKLKRDYADVLRRCCFSLCPRGNGAASIRLFETMKAARVPVILSDEYVLPDGIDWDRCSILVKEADILNLPRILRERKHEWRDLAVNARRRWEENFSEVRLWGRLSQGLRELLARPTPINLSGRIRIRSYPLRKRLGAAVKLGRHFLQAKLRGSNPVAPVSGAR